MEQEGDFQKEKYRHAEFLELIPIKEEKLLKLFLKRNSYPIGIESEILQ